MEIVQKQRKGRKQIEMVKKKLMGNSWGINFGSRLSSLMGYGGETSGTKKVNSKENKISMETNDENLIGRENLANKSNDEVIQRNIRVGVNNNNGDLKKEIGGKNNDDELSVSLKELEVNDR